MNTETFISQVAASAVEALYGAVSPAQIQIQKTRKEFEGDYTLVTFPLLKLSR
jgi:arginyl-tRNA synthetase